MRCAVLNSGLPASARSRISSLEPWMALSRLLKSCAQRLLRLSAADGERQHVGGGLEKADLVLGEVAQHAGVDAEDAIGPLGAVDGNAHPADDAVVVQQGGPAEARLGPQVLDHDRLARDQRVAGLGFESRAHGRGLHQPLFPADPGHQAQLGAVGQQLEHLGALQPERGREHVDRLAHELDEVDALERA
jgi:hypothetical protein